jgi:hypothetical protein
MFRLHPIAFAALAASSAALAQPNISSTNKWAWSENCGWVNWFNAGDPPSAQRVRIHTSFLSGFAWAENIGYINFGDATPANGASYANATGIDFGVNRNPATNELSGLAWGENVGWINFSGGALASPPNPARFDTSAGRLRGFAWGENIGWINLDDATRFVSLVCPADLDDGTASGTPDGGVTIDDLLFFLDLFANGDPRADLDDGTFTNTPDAGVTIDDLLYYLERFANGC